MDAGFLASQLLAMGLGVEGAMDGAELAKDQRVEELEGVDFPQASVPAGIFGQLEQELGIEALVETMD
jgi:hypothetical protein